MQLISLYFPVGLHFRIFQHKAVVHSHKNPEAVNSKPKLVQQLLCWLEFQLSQAA